MASELPSGALGNLASSLKNIVTGQPTSQDGTHTEVAGTTAGAPGVVEKTVEVEVQPDSTAVHKEKAAAVVHENVKDHELEKVDTEVDKEVHQDHYHTTIVPVKDKNVLPTEHVYQENEAEREIDHRDNTALEEHEREAAAIKNETNFEGTTHAKKVAPTKVGEHIHQHIHETIQPVIERETVHKKVIHTTNKIHETEHLNDEHHAATVAPAISMEDFEKGIGGQTKASTTEVSLKKNARSTGATVDSDSKKRDASEEAMDIDEATNVVKRRKVQACKVKSCKCACHQ